MAITLAAPWVLLLLLEAGLRIGGYGSDYPLFERPRAQPDYLMANPRVAWRYFRGEPFRPTPETDFFRAVKTPRVFRVFVQGESSAQGFPYGHGAAPSRMLEQRLQAAFPDREIEVVNTALTAVSSYTLLDQADEILAQAPDAIVIYTGHNEYYGAFGAGSARAIGGRPLVKAYLQLRHVRVAQLFANAVDRVAGAFRRAPDADAPRTVMQLMAGEQRIPLGSPRYERGLAQFRANLAELLARYRARGVPVLIGTVASNERDQPPFEGREAAAAWARAREAAARGDTLAARTAWREAKERDELRFRAPEAINTIIREEAARHGATVVETQQALERASPSGVVGRTLMLEHLHPNIDGYFLIADAFYRAFLARVLPGTPAREPSADSARRALAITPLDSLVGVLRTDRLVSGWPFRARGAERIPAVDTMHPRTRVEELARAVVLGQLPWPEATERLREAAEQGRDPAIALGAARAMAQEFSWSPEPWMDMARAAIQQRRYADALGFVREALARRETPGARQLAGLLMLRLGDRDGAMTALRRAAGLAPRDRRMQVPLQAAIMLPVLEERLAVAPRDTATLLQLATAYAITQQFERARAAVVRLRAVAPASEGARRLLERMPAAAPADSAAAPPA